MTTAPQNLRDWLARTIGRDGPMPVDRFMAECLLHEQYGYYRTHAAIGAAGDFITAPEISQVFGELIGIWAASAWAALGEPARWRLLELGPGRGTLMADILRTLKVVPAARAGLEVVLVEANGVLAGQQRDALAGAGIELTWRASIDDLANCAPLPTVLIANEFLDALPIRQHIARDGTWHQRCVGLVPAPAVGWPADTQTHPTDDLAAQAEQPGIGQPVPQAASHSLADGGDGLRFVLGEALAEPCGQPDGVIREIMSGASSLIDSLAAHVQAPAYLLFIDYGYVGPVFGDTLQAVLGHRYADPLITPGDADLSAQVDFAQVQAAARAAGFESTAVMTQAAFLGQLGAAERLERLARDKPAPTVQSLQAGVARLMQPNGMGGRFKVLALASKTLAPPPAFPKDGGGMVGRSPESL